MVLEMIDQQHTHKYFDIKHQQTGAS
eukprot:UN06902